MVKRFLLGLSLISIGMGMSQASECFPEKAEDSTPRIMISGPDDTGLGQSLKEADQGFADN